MEDSMHDRAYDEAIPVETDDEEEEVSTPGSSEAGSPPGAQAGVGPLGALAAPVGREAGASAGGEGSDGEESGSSSSSEGSSTSESSDGEGQGNTVAAPTGAYNPDDYKHLKVSAEIDELFVYISRYTPHTIDLDTHMKPFVPEFVPSIGEVDAFLKMPRPDGESSGLGTVCLDEPALIPTNPSILELQLRALCKNQDLEPMEVRSIEGAVKKPQEIEQWTKKVDDLNRSRPAPTVQYTRRMPDIEQLMQVWMSEFEEYLQHNPLPDMTELDLDLKEYIKVIAAILDVPVHGNITETLHVIFTLYSEFQSNQHFARNETMGADPYNFGTAASFPGGGSLLGVPGNEYHAPQSRAPSPVDVGGMRR